MVFSLMALLTHESTAFGVHFIKIKIDVRLKKSNILYVHIICTLFNKNLEETEEISRS